MTVAVHDDLVVLSGTCGVEEAEPLLAALLDGAGRSVALDTARIHTSLWQVLLALRPPVLRAPEDTFVVRHLLPRLLERLPPAADPTPDSPTPAAHTRHPHGVD